MTEPPAELADWQKRFSADRPVLAREADRLGRRDFAETVAAAVKGWKGRDSLVIAIYGPWGSGKTSVKNMIVDALREAKDGPLVAEFNPWQFGNRERLSEAFFDQIGISLGKGDAGSKEKRRRLLNKWRRYTAYLKAGGGLLDTASKPLAWVLFVLAILFGSTFFLPGLAWMFVGASVLLAALLRWSSGVAAATSDLFAVGVDTGRRTLAEVKDDMAAELKGLSSPVLVVVDDLDRLSPKDAVEMFQLIKANADLPNLVYLTLFDRDTLAKSIAKVLEVDGGAYLEKIVQVGFDIPVAEKASLDRILFEKLDEVLAQEPVGQRFDTKRWGNLFLGGLQPYFKTLRDVHRFISTLSFHVAVFRGKGAFEVNPVDLIALEVLRVFEPAVYRAIASSRDLLIPKIPFRSDNDGARRSAIQVIVDKAPEERRKQAQEIFKQLFPTAEWAFGGYTYGATFDDGWVRDLRVCSSDMFDRFFHLAIPKGDIPQGEIEAIIQAMGDRGRLRSIFADLSARNLLNIALDRLEAYKETLPLDNAVPFVTALFDIGDRLPRERGRMGETSPATNANRIIYWYLKRLPDQRARAEILLQALRETNGIDLPVQFVALEEQTDKKKAEQGEEILVSDEDLAALKGACLEKIRAAAAGGRLADAPNLQMMLWRWKALAGPEEPRGYCDQLVRTPEGALRLARAFLQASWSHSVGDHVGSEHWYVRLGDLEQLVDWETMERSLEGTEVPSLSAEDGRAVEAFRKAVRRRRAGKPDREMYHSGDDEE